MRKRKVKCLGVNPKIVEFLNSTKNLSDAIDLMYKWCDKNPQHVHIICTNNEYDEELEREWIEDRERLYNYKKNVSNKESEAI